MYVLPFNIVVHIHQIADAFHIIRNVGVAVDGVLDGAGCDREVHHIHRPVVMHHRVDQAAGEGVATADTVEDIEGKQLRLERVPLVPEEGFQAVLAAGMCIAHVAGNALDVGITLDKALENLVLLLIAWLQRHAVLPVAFAVVGVVLPQMVRLDAEQHVDVGQTLGAVVAGFLPAPQRRAEIAVKADSQSFFFCHLQAAQDEICAIFVQRRGDARQVQPVEAVEQLIEVDLRQVILGQGAVHAVVDDLAGADAVAGFQIIGAKAVAGGLLLGGKDHRRAVDVVAAQPANRAFAQRVVRHNAEKRGIHAEVCQRQRNVGLAAAIAGLEGRGHADLLVVRRGKAQHDLTDGDKFLRAGVAHQDRVAVFHKLPPKKPYSVGYHCTATSGELQYGYGRLVF